MEGKLLLRSIGQPDGRMPERFFVLAVFNALLLSQIVNGNVHVVGTEFPKLNFN